MSRAAVTSLPRPAGTFYRAINLNGPALVIDGNTWQGSDAPNYTHNGSRFARENAILSPPTDVNRARMITSSVWNSAGANVTLSAVPPGTYQVLLYVWEDNSPVTYSIYLNGQLVKANHNSGSAGQWHRLGPWPVTVTSASIILTCSAGDANLSGIEIWQSDSIGLRIQSSRAGPTELSFVSESGRTYQIETSADLRTWTFLARLTATGTSSRYTDSAARTLNHLFYRVLRVQ